MITAGPKLWTRSMLLLTVCFSSSSASAPPNHVEKGAIQAPHVKSEVEVGAEEALQRLKKGNERFALHRESHPDQTPERVAKLSTGQHPFAVVLSCSDSRVPPELVFDQGLGDLFVVRVAGNTIDDEVLGSIEYAVEHLGSRLVLVMGHEKCGAVQAALAGKAEPGHIPKLVGPIEPVIEEARKQPGDPVHNTVVLNARHVARQLREAEPVLKERVASGEVAVVSAVYELDSGRVHFDSAAQQTGGNPAQEKPKP